MVGGHRIRRLYARETNPRVRVTVVFPTAAMVEVLMSFHYVQHTHRVVGTIKCAWKTAQKTRLEYSVITQLVGGL